MLPVGWGGSVVPCGAPLTTNLITPSGAIAGRVTVFQTVDWLLFVTYQVRKDEVSVWGRSQLLSAVMSCSARHACATRVCCVRACGAAGVLPVRAGGAAAAAGQHAVRHGPARVERHAL